jgi:hypothetical protein
VPSPKPEFKGTEELSIPIDLLESTTVAQQLLSKGSHIATGQDYAE